MYWVRSAQPPAARGAASGGRRPMVAPAVMSGAGSARFSSVLARAARLVGVAVDLQAGDPEARHAVAVDRTLPSQELFDRQLVAAARLLQADRAVAHSGDNDGLAAHDPALGVRRWQVGHSARRLAGGIRMGERIRYRHVP